MRAPTPVCGNSKTLTGGGFRTQSYPLVDYSKEAMVEDSVK
jgi:hypothetical protein